jgi:hypothetical protein
VWLQVALAFRELEECLNVEVLSRDHLHDHAHAFLATCSILDRRVVTNPSTEADSPPTLYHYLCQMRPQPQTAQPPPHLAHLQPPQATAATHTPPHSHAPTNGFAVHGMGGMHLHTAVPASTTPPAATPPAAVDSSYVAKSCLELLSRGTTPTWVVETAIPLAFIKQQEESFRGGAEYAAVEGALDEADDWMFGGGKSSGGHRGRPPPKEASKSTDSGAPEALASRRSRRNVARKVYYNNEEEDGDLTDAMEARLEEGVQFPGADAPEPAPAGWQDSEALMPRDGMAGSAMDGADGTVSRRKGQKCACFPVLHCPAGMLAVL